MKEEQRGISDRQRRIQRGDGIWGLRCSLTKADAAGIWSTDLRWISCLGSHPGLAKFSGGHGRDPDTEDGLPYRVSAVVPPIGNAGAGTETLWVKHWPNARRLLWRTAIPQMGSVCRGIWRLLQGWSRIGRNTAMKLWCLIWIRRSMRIPSFLLLSTAEIPRQACLVLRKEWLLRS